MRKFITAGIALALLVGPAWGKTSRIACMTAFGGRIAVTVNPGARTASVMLPDGTQSFGSYQYGRASGTTVQTDAVTLAIQDDGRGTVNIGSNLGSPLVCPAFKPIR